MRTLGTWETCEGRKTLAPAVSLKKHLAQTLEHRKCMFTIALLAHYEQSV